MTNSERFIVFDERLLIQTIFCSLIQFYMIFLLSTLCLLPFYKTPKVIIKNKKHIQMNKKKKKKIINGKSEGGGSHIKSKLEM